jgi:uncharacterized protein
LYRNCVYKRFYILSIDGGGLKGLIAIRILRLIQELTGENIFRKFDFLAGTSTGGLIVAALVTGDKHKKNIYDLAHIESLYMEVGQNVFKQGGLALNGRELEKFGELLKDTFGNTRLSETIKPVFIPTYDVCEGRIIGFKTRSALQNKLKDLPLTDVCRATSAIPPVFPDCVLRYNRRLVHCLDAGAHLKNPAIAALAEVMKHKNYYGVRSEKEIALLSISTGSHNGLHNDWSRDINTVLNTQSSDMEYIAKQRLSIDYKSVDFLRVDLNLGGSAFSLAHLLEWMEKINSLEGDREFTNTVRVHLDE